VKRLDRLQAEVAKATHDYVARAACGCVVAICVDCKDVGTAQFVAGEIRKGHTVGRLPVAEAVAALRGDRCAEHAAALERKRAAAAANRASQESLFREEGS
jgi:hypothetical protein